MCHHVLSCCSASSILIVKPAAYQYSVGLSYQSVFQLLLNLLLDGGGCLIWIGRTFSKEVTLFMGNNKIFNSIKLQKVGFPVLVICRTGQQTYFLLQFISVRQECIQEDWATA